MAKRAQQVDNRSRRALTLGCQLSVPAETRVADHVLIWAKPRDADIVLATWGCTIDLSRPLAEISVCVNSNGSDR